MSRKYIQHLRSNTVETIQQYGLDKDIPKVPEADNLREGEIAINFAEDQEVISIKNDDNQIVKFLNEKVIYENEEITAAAMSQLKNEIANEINNINETIENFEPGDAGVQSDWNETDEESLAYIQNKPTNLSDFTNDEGFITLSDVPEVTQSQSDWEEDNENSPAYIQNKPTALSDFTNDTGFITSSDVPVQVQSDWGEEDERSAAFIHHKPTAVSTFTNDAGYLTARDLQTAQIQSDWEQEDRREPSYIQNKPTALSEFTNDTHFITINDVEDEVMYFTIVATYDFSAEGVEPDSITSDTTFSQIRTAYMAGKDIIARNVIRENASQGSIREGDSGYIFRIQYLTTIGAQFVGTKNGTALSTEEKTDVVIFKVDNQNVWTREYFRYSYEPDLKTIGEIGLLRELGNEPLNIAMDDLIAGGIVVESTSGSGQYDSIQLKDRLGNNIGSPINCSQFLTGGLLKSININEYASNNPRSAISKTYYDNLTADEKATYSPYTYEDRDHNTITWQEYENLSSTDQGNYSVIEYNEKIKYMVIEFEDGSSNIKKTMIPLNDIFNSANYYTKSEVDDNIMKSNPLYIYCEPRSAYPNHLEIVSTSNNEYTTFDATFFNIIKNMVRDDTREVIFVEKGHALDPVSDPTIDIYYNVSDIYITPRSNEYSRIVARNLSSGVDGAIVCKTLTYTDEYPNDVILGNASVRPTLVATVSEVNNALTIDKTFSQLYHAISTYDQCVNLKYGNKVLCPSEFYFGASDDTPAAEKYIKFTSVTKDGNDDDIIMDIIVNGLQEVTIDTRTFNEELDGYKIVECSAMDVTFADDFLSRCNYNYASGTTASSVEGPTYDVLVSVTKRNNQNVTPVSGEIGH